MATELKPEVRWDEVEPNLQVRNALNYLQTPGLISRDAPETLVSLTGDGAIARGLLEAGVQMLTAYPGGGLSADFLAPVAEKFGIYVEWSINEKVAFEVAVAGAIAGVRTCFQGKDLGMNVAADTILQLMQGGVEGGMVFISGTDPGAFVSPSEPDVRPYADMFKFMGLDPADPQEAKDMLIAAFDISEQFKLPVLMVETIRDHQSAVELGPLPTTRKTPNFINDRSRWAISGSNMVLPRKRWQLEQLELMKEFVEDLPFNKLEMRGNGELGIITIGTASNFIREAMETFDLPDISVLKLGTFNPLPEKLIEKFLSQLKRVLVIELLDPYIEVKIRDLASRTGKQIEVRGKETGDLPVVGAYSLRMVAEAIGKFIGRDLKLPEMDKQEQRKMIMDAIPVTRNPCPGCPHRSTYYALKQAMRRLGKDYTILTDAGCTSSFGNAPMKMGDMKINMGSSISIMSGLRHSGVEDREIVACIGDSAFFHAGISPLINMTQNGVEGLVVVLDNDSNASTGRQPTASTGVTGMGWDSKKIDVALMAKAANVDFVRTIDPYQQKESQDILEEAISKGGQRLVVSNRECALQLVTKRKMEGEKTPVYFVKEDQCVSCGICVTDFGCPAIYLQDSGKAKIDDALCFGSGACLSVCPTHAFRRSEE